jgi:hypothetical protein
MRTKTMRKLFKQIGVAAALGLLATAAMAQTGNEGFGRLKICKVAGPGVPLWTPFTFTVDNAGTVTVLAGPAPGGSCKIGPLLPLGALIRVTENLTNGNQVTNIKVDPPDRNWYSSGNTAYVQIGSGVTEVTFTNKRTGFLEICKETKPAGGGGLYTFYLTPGNLGPFTVPAGGCSPAIEVPAGTVTIHEVLAPGVHLSSCTTLQGTQISCNPGAGTSTVDVQPGDISVQTIAVMTNAKHIDPTDDSGTISNH